MQINYGHLSIYFAYKKRILSICETDIADCSAPVMAVLQVNLQKNDKSPPLFLYVVVKIDKTLIN